MMTTEPLYMGLFISLNFVGPLVHNISWTLNISNVEYEHLHKPILYHGSLVLLPKHFVFKLELDVFVRTIIRNRFVGLVELDSFHVNLNDKYGQMKLRYFITLPPRVRTVPSLLLLRINNVKLFEAQQSYEMGTRLKFQHSFLKENKNLTRENRYKWLSAIFEIHDWGFRYLCSGLIVSPMYVLTVAHCVLKFNYDGIAPIVVVTGQNDFSKWGYVGSQEHLVNKIIINPEYNSYSLENDIAILQIFPNVSTEQVYTLKDTVRPTILYSPGHCTMIKLISWSYEELLLKPKPTLHDVCLLNQNECWLGRSVHNISNVLCAAYSSKIGEGSSGGVCFTSQSQSSADVSNIVGLVSHAVLLGTKETLIGNIIITSIYDHWNWILTII